MSTSNNTSATVKLSGKGVLKKMDALFESGTTIEELKEMATPKTFNTWLTKRGMNDAMLEHGKNLVEESGLTIYTVEKHIGLPRGTLYHYMKGWSRHSISGIEPVITEYRPGSRSTAKEPEPTLEELKELLASKEKELAAVWEQYSMMQDSLKSDAAEREALQGTLLEKERKIADLNQQLEDTSLTFNSEMNRMRRQLDEANEVYTGQLASQNADFERKLKEAEAAHVAEVKKLKADAEESAYAHAAVYDVQLTELSDKLEAMEASHAAEIEAAVKSKEQEMLDLFDEQLSASEDAAVADVKADNLDFAERNELEALRKASVIMLGDEAPLYDGEFTDIVIECLERAASSFNEGSRYSDVIGDWLAANHRSDWYNASQRGLEKLASNTKKGNVQYRLVKEAGFELSPCVSKHRKVFLCGDRRYATIITESDIPDSKRWSKNLVAELKKCIR